MNRGTREIHQIFDELNIQHEVTRLGKHVVYRLTNSLGVSILYTLSHGNGATSNWRKIKNIQKALARFVAGNYNGLRLVNAHSENDYPTST